ncbi:unnamed protein product [Rhizophagus irregularis]|uniref:HlyIII-domain-containing protein n=2 Tax=Rhizophagus irregularis TaxID=588596 RepID=A0A2N1P2D4_9GLOM|nr:HlyIII-domain-containing protein [Rhizophagus irregularis]CAB4390142.1 unnamed protein product [Rhizophagus irregularis]CAB4420856.1 unnamed protein product [Rhizophagus irregularis]CAB4469441.1 unnamed protein product [Rhizophagus irregularis]CAB5136364.1 unnamed protein product [Rhizophagus irregularis]
MYQKEEKYIEVDEPTSFLRETIKEMEDIDSTGILKCVDQHVVDTYNAISIAAKLGAYRLLHFEELPKEWQENPYIRSGYRFLSTKKQCLQSIFWLHNETCNIWTHLLGFVFFLCLGVYSILTHLENATMFDKLFFAIFFTAAAKCLVCSVMYHTFIHCAHIPVMKCAATFDYIGISLLITASILITEYYSFYCSTSLSVFYITFTSLSGLVPIACSMFPWFDTKQFRLFRVVLFIMLGCSGLFPLAHKILLHGFDHTFNFIQPIISSIFAYLTGVWIYANRYPERKWPGKLDRFGIHSHSLWHVCVCIGIYEHYKASLWFFQQRYAHCPANL